LISTLGLAPFSSDSPEATTVLFFVALDLKFFGFEVILALELEASGYD